MAKRRHNLTGECQICGEKLDAYARVDKMTCGEKPCARKWTRFVKMMTEVSWKIPTGLEKLAHSGEFDGASFHQTEISLEKWKMLHDAIGEGIMAVEKRQQDLAAKKQISYSSQFGFYSFVVHGGIKG